MMGLLTGTLCPQLPHLVPADRAGSRFWRPLSIRDAGMAVWFEQQVDDELARLAAVFGSPQCAVKPPSTGRATPSTRLAAGLNSHRAAAATSSGRPGRPIGWSRMTSIIA
jgi:hypothetical protein